jgi:predicted nucleic acid-binding protein
LTGYLFDTDAISEPLRRRPAPAYVDWLDTIARPEQFTSAVVVGELYKGAFRSPDRGRLLTNIQTRILPAMTVLPYDAAVARVFGELDAQLAARGWMLADADLQIAATAVYHGLVVVTGNIRHFERVPGLKIDDVLARARKP